MIIICWKQSDCIFETVTLFFCYLFLLFFSSADDAGAAAAALTAAEAETNLVKASLASKESELQELHVKVRFSLDTNHCN